MAGDLQKELDNLNNDLTNERYKNLYLLFGLEKNLKNVYKNKIIDTILNESERDMNLEIINKDTYNKDDMDNIINSVPFFSSYRIVILDEINIFNKGELNTILLNIPEQTIVIALEEKSKLASDEDDNGDKKEKTNQALDLNTLKKELGDKCLVINFDKATDDIVESKILEICNENAVKISKLNISYLKERCLGDLSTIENETQKLCMYALNKKEITKDDIDLLVPEALEQTVFDLIKDLTNKNMTGVQKKYKALLYAGNKDKEIVPIVAWQYMLIYETKLGIEENKTPEEMAVISKQKPYSIKQAASLASKISLDKLKIIIKMCNDVYIGLNNGDSNFDVLLDKIVSL